MSYPGSAGRRLGAPLDYGVIAVASGLLPTGIASAAVLVAVMIGVTVFAKKLATKTFWPFGVTAVASGKSPTTRAANISKRGPISSGIR
jgi:uncharacterized membrane protein YccF (DUF307 family)